MRKKNLIILILICILSLCVFSGLLVYAFDLQAKKDLASGTDQNIPSGGAPDVSPVVSQVPSDSAPTTGALVTPLPASISPTPTVPASEADSAHTGPIVLGFAGDVNLDEASYPAKKYDAENKDLTKCLSEDLLKEMNNADIMMLNNEFSYSTRGTKTPDKSYTFRADPGRVSILKEMGVDIVSLANNHALDYGQDALADTFETLDNAGIDYIGAGENLARACSPVYYKIGDKTIAYVAASRVVFAMNWYASDDGAGMVGTYDPSLILKSIEEAEKNSDYVAVFVHWGVERKNYPEEYERVLAQKYIDAGADIVVGCHPHVMQGFEFYKGKPIAYSLGNFWFNNSSNKSGMLKLFLDQDGAVRLQLLPVMMKDTYTYLLTDPSKITDYYSFMQGLSYNAAINQDGFIQETAP